MEKATPKDSSKSKGKAKVTELPVYGLDGKETTRVKVDEALTGGPVNSFFLSQVVLQMQGNRRQGTASTKTRSAVSGGGKKPWRQKGTGRARVGSNRSPLWRGGGVIFGPHPRDYRTRIPKQIRLKALSMSLRAKVRDNEVLLMEPITMTTPKTKTIATFLKALPVTGKTLMVVENVTLTLKQSTRNIPRLLLKGGKDLNAYDLLKHRHLIMERKVFEAMAKGEGGQPKKPPQKLQSKEKA